MAYDFNDFKKDAIDRPSSKAWSNWMKFNKVGDKVQGFIRDVFYRKAEGVYKDARGITLEQADGTLINVSIKRLDFILSKTDGLRLGDPLTVIFEAELPPKKAGVNPTKQYGFYGKNLPENAGNKTVAELDMIDRTNGGMSAEDTADEKLNQQIFGKDGQPAASTDAAAVAPGAATTVEEPKQ